MGASKWILATCIVLLIFILFYLTFENIKLKEEIDHHEIDNQTTYTIPAHAVDTLNNRNNRNNRMMIVTMHLDPFHTDDDSDSDSEEMVPDRGLDYYEESAKKNHNNDGQNSHNSQIVRELKKRWDRLVELNDLKLDEDVNHELLCMTTIATAFREITSHVANLTMSDLDNNKIQKVIDVAKKGGTYGGFSSENDDGTKEDWILTLVWMRIHTSSNDKTRVQLLTAFVDQLKDAGKEIHPIEATLLNHLVNAVGLGGLNQNDADRGIGTECIQGRISRYFQTFTHLDSDELLASPMKDDKEYENEAFIKSHRILQQELEKSNMQELYDRQESELDIDEQKTLSEFKQKVQDRMRSTLTDDYRNLIPAANLETMIIKCIAGV